MIEGSHVSAVVCRCMYVSLCLFPCALFCSFVRAFTVVENYAKNNLDFFVIIKSIDMVYFWAQLNDKSDLVVHSLRQIYPPFLPQCNNSPHENCNNLPQGGIFY